MFLTPVIISTTYSDRKDVSLLLSKVDINAVAGVLKLYFRELPEPLFTNSKYRFDLTVLIVKWKNSKIDNEKTV